LCYDFNTMNYSFYLKNQALKNGEFPMYMRISNGRKSKYVSLGFSCKTLNFHKEKKIIKKTDIQAFKKNSIIKAYIQKADSLILENIISKNSISLDLFAKKLKNIDSVDFYKFARRVTINKNVSNNTQITYNTRISKLRKFRPELSLNDVTEEFINSYYSHLINPPNNIAISSANNYIFFINSILIEAMKEGIIDRNPCNFVKLKKSKNEKPFLNNKDLSVLENLFQSKTLKPTFQSTLQVFLFSCYTGISYIDLVNLKYDQIVTKSVDQKSHHMIIGLRQKTGIKYRVPLNSKALNIIHSLKKYTNRVFSIGRPMTLVYHFEHLRKKTPEIDIHYTFHTARHTFASNCANNGIDELLRMEMLGHTRAETNRIYSKIQDDFLIKEFASKIA